MVLADANYKLIYINVGTNARNADGDIFNDSTLAKSLELGTALILENRSLLNHSTHVTFGIVDDCICN